MINAEVGILLATGLMLGLGHSLDPDHVVAVSTILCKCTSLRKSIGAAAAWGAGHTITVLVVGLLVLALSVSIPNSVLRIFDFAAGAMLVVLGALLLRPIIARKLRPRDDNSFAPSASKHFHIHAHGGHIHIHGHSHENDNSHVHKSALAGVLQGLAGSAALMLVTLATVNSVELGLIFIALFGAGVILGMVCISCAISSVLKYTATRLENVHEKISIVTACISIGFGFFLMLQVLLNLNVYI
jgi:ABC-type nickel/cobalt efflux system permease component RcnA